MVALAPNTSETSSWDILDGFPKLHSRAREVKTRICTEAPCSKSLSRVEIWLTIYDCRVGLESLTRDPIGFEGSEWGLYSLVNGRVTNEVDPLGMCPCQGKPRSIKECCDQSELPGGINFGGNWIGRAFCCDGRIVSCVFMHNHPAKNKKSIKIISGCVLRHEESHKVDAGPCPASCPDMSEGTYPPGMNDDISECKAARRELACLKMGLDRCNRDKIVNANNSPCDPLDIENAMTDVRKNGELRCGKANMNWPFPP